MAEATQAKQEKPVKEYDQADLVVECACGNTTVIDTNIKGGLQIILPTDDNHAIKLVCGACGAKLTLKFVEAANPKIDEVVEDALVIEDVDAEQLPEVDDTDIGDPIIVDQDEDPVLLNVDDEENPSVEHLHVAEDEPVEAESIDEDKVTSDESKEEGQ